jgi:expansin
MRSRTRALPICLLLYLEMVGSGGCSRRSTLGEQANSASVLTPCLRTVPESVEPAIPCTPYTVGSAEYDGCSGSNLACGPVFGCPVDRYGTVSGTIPTQYAPGPAGFHAPMTALQAAMGDNIQGKASGWFDWQKVDSMTGSCSYPPAKDLMIGALNGVQYGNGEWCGACAEIVGRSGKRVRILIMNLCPGCPDGWLDLAAGKDSPYDLLNVIDPSLQCLDGAIPITWKVVPCETQGGIVIHYQLGWNQLGPAIQVRNHRLPLIKLEEYLDGAWYEVQRQNFNVFTTQARAGQDVGQPLTLRITAIDGATITGTFPPYEGDADHEASSQF